MKKIIEDNELGLPISTPFDRSILGAVKNIVGINRLNNLYAKMDSDGSPIEFVRQALDQLGVTLCKDPGLDNKIPASGGLVVVANYPHGGIDGLVLLDSLLKIRPDVKIIADVMLQKIKPIDSSFIAVDTSGSLSSATVIAGLRAARRHIDQGGALVIFPAAGVASHRKRKMDLSDNEWSLFLMKFIASTRATVLPAYISGKNSIFYYFIRKFNNRLGAIRLVRELFNKQGKSIEVRFGRPISYALLSSLANYDEWITVLRANIVLLQAISKHLPLAGVQSNEGFSDVDLVDQSKSSSRAETADLPTLSVDRAMLVANEVRALGHSERLFSQGDYDLFFASVDNVPLATQYIDSIVLANATNSVPRLRHSDQDTHKHILFCWDRVNAQIAAAVRVGFGNEIFDAIGIDGFYCCTEFDFSHKFLPTLRSSIEIGCWALTPQYAKFSEPSWLLWRGQIAVLMRSDRYDYLLSVVELCNSESVTARRLIVNHLQAHYYNNSFEKQIVARHPLRSLIAPMFDVRTMKTLNRRELMESFIADADPAISPLSPMAKRFVQVGGQAIALCSGHSDDRNSLYALSMVDVAKMRSSDMQLFHVEQ